MARKEKLLIVNLLLLYFPNDENTKLKNTRSEACSCTALPLKNSREPKKFPREFGHFGGTPGFSNSCRLHDKENGRIWWVPRSTTGKCFGDARHMHIALSAFGCYHRSMSLRVIFTPSVNREHFWKHKGKILPFRRQCCHVNVVLKEFLQWKRT